MLDPMWDERYAADGYFYGTEPNDFLAEHAAAIPPGPVLELAAGEGRNGVWLAQRGHAVTAVDGSSVGLAKAEALARARGVAITTVCADLASYAIAPATWSGVVSIFCHLPPALRARVLGEAARGLVPGGALILEAYTPAQLAHGTGGPKDRALLVTLDELRADLAGLELEIAREVEREIHEGTGHGGLSAVVQVVARRPR